MNEERFELHARKQVVGYAAVIDCGHEFWIAEIWVTPGAAHRGRGAGRALLAAVIARHGAQVLALSPEPFTQPGDRQPQAGALTASDLAAWYIRHGFRWDGPRRMMRPVGP